MLAGWRRPISPRAKAGGIRRQAYAHRLIPVMTSGPSSGNQSSERPSAEPGAGPLQEQTRAMPIPFLACMVATAAFYNLPPRVLPSIQVVEAGRPNTVSPNTDGSFDLGVMQVNTLWVPRFAAMTGMSPDEVRRRLIADPCFNIAAGGAIMRLCLNESKGDLLRAVGLYHSHTPARADAYQAKVLRAATRLFTHPPPMAGTLARAN